MATTDRIPIKNGVVSSPAVIGMRILVPGLLVNRIPNPSVSLRHIVKTAMILVDCRASNSRR